MVGSSGAAAERLALVTASARSLPPRTCGMAEAMLPNIRLTCPASKSVSAGLLPLYGTCTMRVPVMALNNTVDKCVALPLPAEP